MKEIDATRLKLAALELVEGTDIRWWQCIRNYDWVLRGEPKRLVDDKENYELALGIIEGKPVWEGDELYYGDNKIIATTKQGGHFAGWSWLPPKPRTAMVELLVDDINDASNWNCGMLTPLGNRISEACRKTLKQLK